MSNKFFVLDTNVLIHSPTALYAFSDNTVVIPITVIEELDTFKTSLDKKGKHARQVLRELDKISQKGALSEGAKIKTGGKLKIAFPPIQTGPLDPIVKDNRILSVALTLLQEHKTEVYFVSKDVNARIKAEALGIKARDYEKQKVEYSSLYKGWREFDVTSQDITDFYKHEQFKPKVNLLENEYVLLKSQDASHVSALGKYVGKKGCVVPIKGPFEAMGIKPVNIEQQFAFDLLLNDDIPLVTLIGQAGTGKTLIALACGLQRVMGKSPRYDKLLVARPIMPLGKDIGYLPGTKDQKLNYWMQPIFDNLTFILQKDRDEERGGGSRHRDKIDYLLDTDILEIEAITYIRGRSIPNQFIIIDEAQNLTPHEVKTIISRVGKGTKIVLTGDPEQIDNPYLDANSNGLSYTADRLKNYPLTGNIVLSKSERSELASLVAELL